MVVPKNGKKDDIQINGKIVQLVDNIQHLGTLTDRSPKYKQQYNYIVP